MYKPEVAMGRFGRILGEQRKTAGVHSYLVRAEQTRNPIISFGGSASSNERRSCQGYYNFAFLNSLLF